MRHQSPRGRPWFEEMYETYRAQLRAFAVRRVGPDAAEDVVAEVFTIAWRRRAEVPNPELPWLYQVARNEVLHTYRSRGRDADRIGAVAASGGRTAPSAETSSMAVIDSVLAGLEPTDAEVLRLTVWEELTPSEIAEVLGARPGAIRNRLMRARRRAQELFVQSQLIPAMQGDSHA